LLFHPIRQSDLAMAEAKRNSIHLSALAALCLSAHTAAFAQFIPAQSGPAQSPPQHSVQIQSPQSGSLAGRLTDLHSAPLAGVTLVLRNQSTGAEVRTNTTKNGAFHFVSLDTGEYSLDADAANLGHGSLEGIVVTGGTESRVQAAMVFNPVPPALLLVSASPQIYGPPSLPRPTLNTTSPQLIASVKEKPLNLLPLRISTATMTPSVSAPFTPPTQTPPQFATLPEASTQIVPSVAAPTVTAPYRVPTTTPGSPTVAASPSVPAAPSAPQLAQRPIQISDLPQRAALETQSASTQLALNISPQRPFQLKAAATSVLPATATLSASIVQAALLNSLPVAATIAAAQPSDPVTPAAATTLTAAQLQALPATGRRWQEFLLDTPAAGASPDGSQASFRGSQQSAGIAVDGVNTTLAFGVSAGSPVSGSSGDEPDPERSTNSSSSQTWAGARGLRVSEAAIREVTTAAGNVEAEDMRSADGRTSIRTESGGNAFHGQGFFFDRQNTWGAQNPYTEWLQDTGTAPTPGQTPIVSTEPVFSPIPFTPPDHETVWGIGAGGDIRRNKLFWFTALDSNHRNDPGLAMAKEPIGTYTDPTSGDDYCFGFFCAPSGPQALLLSAQLGESESQAANDYNGVPGSAYLPAGLEQLASILAPAPRTSAQWVGFARIDWQATERHHLTLEGIGARWNSPGGGLTGVSTNYGDHSFGSSQASQQWLLARWESYLTPNLLAVTQGSAGRAILSARPDAPSAFEQSFLNGNSWGQLPQIVVDSRYGFTIGNPSRFGQGDYPDERLYNGQQMLDWVHNKLMVKAGFELDHNSDAVSELRNQTGTYSYSTVASFISDALAFQKFGLGDALDSRNPHNCGLTNTTFGSQPCYSYFSQTIGPTNWHLSTNDWAGFVTAQRQLSNVAVFSAGLRWEREELPPPIASVDNPELPFTQKLPNLGNNWGPRVSLALGAAQSHWPVLRLGYGMYFGRVENATIETALTQTGSLNGDLYFFMRPQDDCQDCPGGGAPPFPHVLTGPPASVVKPGVVGFAPNFRNPEIHQAIASIEETLPGHIEFTAAAMLSLGRLLPVSIDTNVNTNISSAVNTGITYNVCDQVPLNSDGTSTSCGHTGAGPIKTAQVTVPYFYASSWSTQGSTQSMVVCPYDGVGVMSTAVSGRLCPDYQAITQITSKANSTYEAVMVKLVRYGRRGLSLHANYTYAHTMDWNPDAVTLAPGSDVLDPAALKNPSIFKAEYGTSNQDVRHSAAVIAIFEAPWKLRGFAGRLGNGWAISGIGQFHSGLPYSMRITGSIPTAYESNATGLGSSMNGYGGDNRYFGLPRNAFRYPETWKADLRLAKRFDLGETRQLELLVESFNLFNHQNVTEIQTTGYSIQNGGSTTPPSLNFLTGLHINPKTGLSSSAFGQPLSINGTDFYRERQIQIGLRMRF
jgi:hypothetical protein